MALDLSLLERYSTPDQDRQEFAKKLSRRQITRGWNARISNKDPNDHGFKPNTKPAKEFILGLQQCEHYLKTGEAPEFGQEQLHTELIVEEYTIAQIINKHKPT